MRRFYASKENFSKQTITLSPEETRHLHDVLRLRAGEKAQVFDGEGNEFLCEIIEIAKKETVLKIIKRVSSQAPESDLDLTLAVAILKGEKFDLVLQKAVELGVTTFIPLATKRADVKLKDDEKRLERWRKIIIDASKQSGRAKLMRIEKPIVFAEFIKKSAINRLGGDSLLLFAERSGERFSEIKTTNKMIVVVGSEGGWDDAEIALARESGFQIITLKGRVLRAETAAIAIAAVMQNRFGDFI